jgi:hypothetical protein
LTASKKPRRTNRADDELKRVLQHLRVHFPIAVPIIQKAIRDARRNRKA